MLVTEIFDKEKALADFEKEKKAMKNQQDTETSPADMIITKFETGKITYDQAKKELLAKDYGMYIHELNMAAELQDDKKRMN